MIVGHDIDFHDRTPETLDSRPVFRATILRTKELIEHASIVPRKDAESRDIPTSFDSIHFLSPTKFWHSWQYNVIKNSDFVKQENIQRKIKRFLYKSNTSYKCELNTLKAELQV